MQINGYDLRIVCANWDKEVDTYGGIYESLEECKKDHPDDEVFFGYYLHKDGEDTPDIFMTLDQAIVYALTGEDHGCGNNINEEMWQQLITDKYKQR